MLAASGKAKLVPVLGSVHFIEVGWVIPPLFLFLGRMEFGFRIQLGKLVVASCKGNLSAALGNKLWIKKWVVLEVFAIHQDLAQWH